MTPEPVRIGAMGTPLVAALAVLPCRDLDRSCAFYARVGLQPVESAPDYRLLVGHGVELHLRLAAEALPPFGANPCGVYLRVEAVDALAAGFSEGDRLRSPQVQPWGMYEFAVSDLDGALVRVGWPERLRAGGTPPLETPSAELGN